VQAKKKRGAALVSADPYIYVGRKS